jgi:hypothetical protein
LVRKGNKASGRFPTRAFVLITDLKDIAVAPYDQRWRTLRKFAHQTMFNSTALKNVNDKLVDRAEDCLSNIKKHALEGKELPVVQTFKELTIGIMFLAITGELPGGQVFKVTRSIGDHRRDRIGDSMVLLEGRQLTAFQQNYGISNTIAIL